MEIYISNCQVPGDIAADPDTKASSRETDSEKQTVVFSHADFPGFKKTADTHTNLQIQPLFTEQKNSVWGGKINAFYRPDVASF